MSDVDASENGVDELFVVDSSPAMVQENLDIPSYETKFNNILQAQTSQDTNLKSERPKPPKNVCWNCEGDHSLRDCTERRDQAAISRNRAIFLSKQSTPRGGKASRYHQDEEQKFPHHQPGKISSRLRRALGLKSNQLPKHIYRMRSLGYPPGWVEEARVSHSGLVLFNSAGEEVADPGFGFEDGEIVADGAKDKYDIRKIIEYPGFNCQCSSDIIDETERLNARQMAEIDSIERMISIWQPRAVQAYKRKKMKSDDPNTTPHALQSSKPESIHSASNTEESVESEEDGEICDESNFVIDSPTSSTEPNKNLKRSQSSSSECPEVKKQKLEEELVSGDDSSSDVNQRKSGIVRDTTETIRNSPGDAATAATTPDNSSMGRVKSVSLGTPVIVKSQYTNLPTPEKFSKNICDVINFENLPDSTGKYEKMSGLLKKVRVTVSKMSDDAGENDG